MQKRMLQEDVFEYEFDLSWDEEQARKENGRVSLQWRLPNGDVQYMWHPTIALIFSNLCLTKRVYHDRLYTDY